MSETIALWQDVTGLSAADAGWYEEFARFRLTCAAGLSLPAKS